MICVKGKGMSGPRDWDKQRAETTKGRECLQRGWRFGGTRSVGCVGSWGRGKG